MSLSIYMVCGMSTVSARTLLVVPQALMDEIDALRAEIGAAGGIEVTRSTMLRSLLRDGLDARKAAKCRGIEEANG